MPASPSSLRERAGPGQELEPELARELKTVMRWEMTRSARPSLPSASV